MWAAPGTLARTVPWQLDPSRRPDSYATDAVLTDRRLVFLGTQQGTLSKADELWDVPREDIAEARQMKYSEIGGDVRITFRDGSWIRLFTVRRTAPRAWPSSSTARSTPSPRPISLRASGTAYGTSGRGSRRTPNHPPSRC